MNDRGGDADEFEFQSVSDIRASVFDLGTTIQVNWLDGGGRPCAATRRGPIARRLIDDLTAVSVIGEVARRCYLVGLVRGLADMGDLDP